MTPRPSSVVLESIDGAGAPAASTYDADALTRRLKRIEGVLRGICRMLESSRPCIEIAQQTSAANNALRQISVEVLKHHGTVCVGGRVAGQPAAGPEVAEDLLNLFARRDEAAKNGTALTEPVTPACKPPAPSGRTFRAFTRVSSASRR